MGKCLASEFYNKTESLLERKLINYYFHFSGCYGLQRFAEQPKYTEVNPGEDALLTCKIIDKRGSCSWQKDNKVKCQLNLDVKLCA